MIWYGSVWDPNKIADSQRLRKDNINNIEFKSFRSNQVVPAQVDPTLN